MNGKVDVLEVLDEEIRSLPKMASAIRFAGAKYGWRVDESDAVRRMQDARAAVAELIDAIQMFVDDSEGVDLGGGDAVVTTCESLQAAVVALARVKGK